MSVLSSMFDNLSILMELKKDGLKLDKKVVEEKNLSEVVNNQKYSLFVGKWILYSSANYENKKRYDGEMILFHVSVILRILFS